MEYLRRLRVEHASELLSTTELPPQEISDICAFADPAHFTRVFRSVLGTPARAYRRLATVTEPAAAPEAVCD